MTMDTVRIWLQSNTGVGHDPRWDAYRSAQTQQLDSARDPQTEITLAGVPAMEPEHGLERSAFVRWRNVRQVIDNGLRAQDEGWDAFVVVGMATTGFEELRDALRIPVVYNERAAWHSAVLLHGRFGLVAHARPVYVRRVEQVRAAGLSEWFVPGPIGDLSVDECLESFDRPGRVVDALRPLMSATVANGAQVLVPDNNVFASLLLHAGCTRVDGVPVLDTAGNALKWAEMLVRAGRRGVLRPRASDSE